MNNDLFPEETEIRDLKKFMKTHYWSHMNHVKKRIDAIETITRENRKLLREVLAEISKKDSHG